MVPAAVKSASAKSSATPFVVHHESIGHKRVRWPDAQVIDRLFRAECTSDNLSAWQRVPGREVAGRAKRSVGAQDRMLRCCAQCAGIGDQCEHPCSCEKCCVHHRCPALAGQYNCAGLHCFNRNRPIRRGDVCAGGKTTATALVVHCNTIGKVGVGGGGLQIVDACRLPDPVDAEDTLRG